MSVRRLAKNQPKSFAFSEENRRWAEEEVKKYPERRQASAVLALLWRAQEQGGGWVSEPAIRHVAEFLDMPPMRVLEVATFYTMFNLEPVGKYFFQLCGTTPCLLNGADNLKQVCRRYIGEEGRVFGRNQMSWKEVECLGACVDAPVIQINEDYYERLDPDSLAELIERLKGGEDIEAIKKEMNKKSGRQSDKGINNKEASNV